MKKLYKNKIRSLALKYMIRPCDIENAFCHHILNYQKEHIDEIIWAFLVAELGQEYAASWRNRVDKKESRIKANLYI